MGTVRLPRMVDPMTRRRVLYTLAALTTPILALWAAHTLDHLTGWDDPRWRT